MHAFEVDDRLTQAWVLHPLLAYWRKTGAPEQLALSVEGLDRGLKPTLVMVRPEQYADVSAVLREQPAPGAVVLAESLVGYFQEFILAMPEGVPRTLICYAPEKELIGGVVEVRRKPERHARRPVTPRRPETPPRQPVRRIRKLPEEPESPRPEKCSVGSQTREKPKEPKPKEKPKPKGNGKGGKWRSPLLQRKAKEAKEAKEAKKEPEKGPRPPWVPPWIEDYEALPPPQPPPEPRTEPRPEPPRTVTPAVDMVAALAAKYGFDSAEAARFLDLDRPMTPGRGPRAATPRGRPETPRTPTRWQSAAPRMPTPRAETPRRSEGSGWTPDAGQLNVDVDLYDIDARTPAMTPVFRGGPRPPRADAKERVERIFGGPHNQRMEHGRRHADELAAVVGTSAY